MRTTVFSLDGDKVDPQIDEKPEWQPFNEYDGKPLTKVALVELLQRGTCEMQLVEIRAGGHFAMHSSPDIAFCQIVYGRGELGLPDGTELRYEGPELYVFMPDTLHDWHDVEEDTLLSVCLIEARSSNL
jgi:quercetin dioxygenase-like cupin family protein